MSNIGKLDSETAEISSNLFNRIYTAFDFNIQATPGICTLASPELLCEST